MPPKAQAPNAKPKPKPATAKRRRPNKSRRLRPVRAMVNQRFGGPSATEALAAFMIIPREVPPRRMPIISQAGIKTALSTILTRGNFTVRASTSSTIINPDERANAFWMVMRSPIAPVWDNQMFTFATTTNMWSIRISPVVGASTVTDFFYSQYTINAAIPIGPPLGRSPDVTPMIYVPAGTLVNVAISSAGTTTSVTVNVKYWYTATDMLKSAITVPITSGAGSGQLTASQGIWLSVTSLESTTPLLNTTAAIISVQNPTTNAFTMLLPSFPTPEVANASLLYTSARLASSSFLLSNVSPKLYQSGRFVCARTTTDGVNAWTPSSVIGVVTTANVANSYDGKAADGVYTWTVPDQNSLLLTDYLQVFPGISSSALVFDLRDADFANVIIYSGNTGVATTEIAQTFAYEYTQVVEYSTTSQIVTIATTPYHSNDLETAIHAVARIPPFKENPFHLGIAKQIIAQAGRAAWPVIRPIVRRGLRSGYRALRSYL